MMINKDTLNLTRELASAKALMDNKYSHLDIDRTAFYAGWLVSTLAVKLRDMGHTDVADMVRALTVAK